MNKTELIKNTFEMKYYKIQISTTSSTILLSLIYIIIALLPPMNTYALLPPLLLIFLPISFTVYYAYKVRSFLAEPNRYDVLNATVTGAHKVFGLLKGGMCLDLEITTSDGGVIHTESKGVYSRSIISDQYYENFVGNNFRVLYDRTTSTVLIINE
jgi:hypothetical protein